MAKWTVVVSWKMRCSTLAHYVLGYLHIYITHREMSRALTSLHIHLALYWLVSSMFKLASWYLGWDFLAFSSLSHVFDESWSWVMLLVPWLMFKKTHNVFWILGCLVFLLSLIFEILKYKCFCFTVRCLLLPVNAVTTHQSVVSL